MRFYRWWRQFWSYCGPVVAIVSLGKLIGFTANDVVVVGHAAGAFVLSQKAVWLAVSVLAIFFSYVEWRHRSTPVTVISTEIELYIEKADGSEAHLSRKQVLRANHDNVTGYRRKFWVGPAVSDGATIPKDSIKMHISHCNAGDQDRHIEGTPRSWEVIHTFKNPIPMELTRFGLNTVERRDEYRMLRCFMSEEEAYSFIIPGHYPHRDVTLKVFFHPDNCCSITDCKGLWISNSGIVNLIVTPIRNDAGREGVQLTLKNPVRETEYQVRWRYPVKPSQV